MAGDTEMIRTRHVDKNNYLFPVDGEEYISPYNDDDPFLVWAWGYDKAGDSLSRSLSI